MNKERDIYGHPTPELSHGTLFALPQLLPRSALSPGSGDDRDQPKGRPKK